MLKQVFGAAPVSMDAKFSTFAIYAPFLPLNEARADDAARGIEWPEVWTADRDREW